MVKFTPGKRSAHVDGIETYEKRVKRLYEGRDNLPVIVRGTPAWDAWMNYFAHIGHTHALPSSFAASRGRMTVPEIDPDRFDPGFHCSNRAEQNYAYAAE